MAEEIIMTKEQSYTQPIVSVIIPIYKVEEYLRECLDSVLSQTYENLEIILVDDGSPDQCGEICDEYATKDSRIKVIHKENGGLSDARNAGLDICTGEYISFIDSDDVVHPQFLEILYNTMHSADADISFCDFKKFVCRKDIDKKQISDNNGIEEFSGKEFINTLFDKLWVPKNIVVWNKLYKKKIFQKQRFPKGLTHEDEYIFTDLYSNDNIKIVYRDFALVYYRVREGSIIMHRYSENNVVSFFKIYQKRDFYFNQTGRKDLKEKNYKNICRYLFSAIINNSKKAYQLVNVRAIFTVLTDSSILWKSRIIFAMRLFQHSVNFKK